MSEEDFTLVSLDLDLFELDVEWIWMASDLEE